MRLVPSTRKRLAPLAIVTSAAVALGIVGLSAPAQAAPGDTSNAAARVLGGSLLSTVDTNAVVGLGGSTASYPSNSGPNTAGLDPSLLSAVDVNLGTVTVPLGDLVQLGAVTQFSQAQDGGSSHGTAAVAASAGGLTVGNAQTTTPTAALVDLGPLLDEAGLSGALDQASVSVGAVSADADLANATTLTRTYSIASLNARLHSQLVAGLTGDVDDLINGTVTPTLNTLTSTITDTVNTALGTVGAITSLVPGVAFDTTVTLGGTNGFTDDLTDAVHTVLNQKLTSADGAVTLNPATGTIDVDLAALAGGLNNRDPETQVLSATTLNALVQDVNDLLDQLGTNLITAINTAVDNIPVVISSTLDGGLLGTLHLGINTTLGALAAGTPLTVDTTGSTGVLGAISGLAGTLASTLGRALEPVVSSALGDLTSTVTNAITGSGGLIQGVTTGLDPVLSALSNVVGLTLNHQTSSGGVSTEMALQLTLLNSTAAQLNLATASVGPNAIAPVISGLTPDQGPTSGGQSVTISGNSSLQNATTVDFGGTTVYLAGSTGASDHPGAPTFTQDATTGDIHLTTPAHAAGAVDVTVTSPSGTSAPATYTYVAVPANLALSPDAGTTAGGQTVTLTGDDLGGATSVSFGGTTFYLAGGTDAAANPSAPTFTQASDGTITLSTPAHAAGPVDVTVTTPGGTTPAVTYTYYATPANLALDPDQGPVAGRQQVTITGDNLGGATSVDFGGTAYSPAGSGTGPFFTQDATTGAITLSTPSNPVGAVDVTITNPAGTSAPASYTYVAAPGNLSLSPDQGPAAGGQTVVIAGDNLGTASSVDFGGTTFYLAGSPEAAAHPDAPTFTQDGATGAITLVTPAGAAGAVDVTVTTAGGTAGPVTYTYVTGPAVTSVTPGTGPVEGGQSVTIAGDDLGGATSVDFGGTTYYPAGDAGNPAGAPTFTQDPATGAITLTTPPGSTSGPVDVTVTTPGGDSPAFPYTYVAAPVAGTLTPNSGPVAGGQTVTLTGTDLTDAASVDFGGTTYYLAGSPDAAGNPDAPTFTQASDGTITLSTPAHAAGDVAVTVTTAGGTTAPLTYTYVAVPAVTGLSPNDGPLSGGQSVDLTGDNLCGATQVDFGGTTYYLAGSTAATNHPTAPTFTESATCVISLTTPMGTGAGPVDVTVTTPGGESAPAQYTYVAAPANLELNPGVGPVTGGQTVTITGDNLLTATEVDFGGTTFYPAGSPEAEAHSGSPLFTHDNTTGTITLTTPPAAAPASVDVTVTNPGGTSSALPYTYVAAPSNVTLSPDHGPQSGGTTVVLTGDDLDDATAVTVGGVTYYPEGSNAAAAHPDAPTFTQDAATGAITLTTQPSTASGPVDVTVTTAGGTSPAASYTFDPAPVIGGVSPSSGPTGGGQSVTISGDNLTGATQVDFGGTTFYPEGSTSAGPTFTQNQTTGAITLDTPAHAAGPVDVTVTTPRGTSNAATYNYGLITPGTVSISGSPEVGGTLVGNPGTWNPSDVSLKYTWTLPDGTVIGTGQTLVVPNSAAGKTVTLTVTGTKSGYDKATATATKPVAAYNGPVTQRLQGPQRYDTAIAISKDSYPVKGSASVVYIAQSENFPDALSAGPAAVKQNGPLLLTPHNQLIPSVKAEIQRLGPSKIVVVGGTAAITPSVFNALGALAPTVREGGQDRYATSLAIAKYAFGSSLGGVFVATGTTFPDALSAAAYAGSHNEPVLLVNGTASSAPTAVTSYLKSAKPKTVSIAGGTAAVTNGIAQSLKTATGVTPKRLGGADRYATSQLINAQFTTAPAAYLATGVNFPDALTGAAAAGKIAAPLYVIPGGCVPSPVLKAFTNWKTGLVKILGGPAALAAPAVDKLQACK